MTFQGRISCISGAKDSPEYEYIRQSYDNLAMAGHGSTAEFIESKQDLVKLCPQLTEACGVEDWKGLWNPEDGWVHAKKALERWARACEEMGVKLISGADGTIVRLKVGTEGALLGVETKSGKTLKADQYILTLGAASPAILPNLLATHLWSKCWTLAHIKLTPDEMAQWKNIPVVDNRDLGFTFEPDPETSKPPPITHLYMFRCCARYCRDVILEVSS
jgi:sarcosine oxidase / L-pipecolate oxidase